MSAEVELRVKHTKRFRTIGGDRYPHQVAKAYDGDLERAATDSDAEVAATVAAWERSHGLPIRDWPAIGAERDPALADDDAVCEWCGSPMQSNDAGPRTCAKRCQQSVWAEDPWKPSILSGRAAARRRKWQRVLDSKRWHDLRDRVIAVRGGCEDCGVTSTLTLHHLTYERLGRELSVDVVLLCKPCHWARYVHDNPELF